VPRVTKQATQEWMTPEILDLMEERRKCKKNTQQYKQLVRIIRNKCLEAKESFYSRQCEELERYSKDPIHRQCMTKYEKSQADKKEARLLTV